MKRFSWHFALLLPIHLIASWTTPTTLSTTGSNAKFPRLAKGGTDNEEAMALWGENNGSNNTPRASLFNGTTWSASVELDTMELATEVPKIGMDDSGNSIALWQSANNAIKTSFFNGSSWSAPTTHTTLNLSDNGLALDMTAGGNAILCLGHGSLSAYLFDGATWSGPFTQTQTFSPLKFSRIYLNESDEAIAFYAESSDPKASILRNNVWQDLSFGNSVQGNLVWGGFYGIVGQIFSNNKALMVGYDGSMEITISSGKATTSRNHTDILPSAFESEVETDGMLFGRSNTGMRVVTYNGKQWSKDKKLSTASNVGRCDVVKSDFKGLHFCYRPSLSKNSSGEAIALWIAVVGGKTVIRSSYFDGSSWSTAETISLTGTDNDPHSPQVVIDDNGDGIAIWQSTVKVAGKGINTIREARFTP